MAIIELRRVRSGYKKILLFAVAQGVQYATSFMAIKILASKLSVANFGLYNLVLTTCFVVSMLPFTAFDQIINRKVITVSRATLNISPFLFVYFGFIIIAHGGLACIYNLLPERIRPLVLVIIFYSVTNIFKTTLSGILNFTNNRVGFNVLKIIDNILKVAIIYVIAKESDLENIFSYLIIENLVLLFIWYLFYGGLLKPWKWCKLRYYIWYLLAGAAPLLIWAPFELVQNNLYVYFLEYNHYKEEVAFFGFYNSLSLVIPAGIGGIIASYALPQIYKMVGLKTFNQVTRYTFNILLIYIILSAIAYGALMVVIKPLIIYLSKTVYLEQLDIFNYLYIANLIFNASIIGTNLFFAYKKQSLLIPVKIIPGLICFILLMLFTHTYGLAGIKVIFVTVSVIQVAIAYVAFIKLKSLVK